MLVSSTAVRHVIIDYTTKLKKININLTTKTLFRTSTYMYTMEVPFELVHKNG